MMDTQWEHCRPYKDEYSIDATAKKGRFVVKYEVAPGPTAVLLCKGLAMDEPVTQDIRHKTWHIRHWKTNIEYSEESIPNQKLYKVNGLQRARPMPSPWYISI